MSDKPRRLKRTLLLVASVLAVLLVAALIVLTTVPFGNDPHTPGIGSINLELQSATIEANNQLSSSSSTSHATHSQIPLRRIAVVNASDHLIMKRVTEHVADHLRSLPFTDTVDVVASFDAIPPGSELYDQYITLDAPALDLSGLMINGQSLDATLKINMSPSLFTSRTSIHTARDLPVFKLNYQATLDHTSTTTGYESANARHKTVAKNIADELNKSLAKTLSDAVGKVGARSALPVSFVSDYQPVPDPLQQALAIGWAQQLSGHGYMTPNTTVWTRTTTDPDAVLTQLIGELIDAGWHGPTEPREDPSHWHLRYTAPDRDQVLDVFDLREGYDPPTQGEPVKIVIRYRQRMAESAVRPLIDELIARQDEVSFEDLLPLLNLMTTDHKTALAERVMASPPRRTGAAMAAARLLHDIGHTEQATELLNSVTILFELQDDGVSKHSLEKLGQTITGDPEWEIPTPSVAQLDAAGFHRLTFGQPIEAEVALNEHVLAYVLTDESKGEYLMIAPRVIPSRIPEGIYTLQVNTAGNNAMGNSSSTSTTHHPQRPWRDQHHSGINDLRYRIQAEEIDEQTFRITVTASETQAP